MKFLFFGALSTVLFLGGGINSIAFGSDENPCQTTPNLPSLLSSTCFYNSDGQTLRKDVYEFVPEFPLWSDGAKKHRYVSLPADKKIDTSEMDQWVFPVGTKFWKEFSKNGIRVETRLLVKVADGSGPQAWLVGTYAWRKGQDDAELVTEGVPNALGSGHNIPKTTSCLQCHGGAKDLVLGFEAIQMSHEEKGSGGIDLRWLTEQEYLSHVPAKEFHIPGSKLDQSALGYIHANCASCHNPRGSVPYLNFKHNLNATSVTEQNAFQNLTKMRLVVRGTPEKSRILKLMSQRPGMPKIASDFVDEEGVQMIRDWIQSLQ